MQQRLLQSRSVPCRLFLVLFLVFKLDNSFFRANKPRSIPKMWTHLFFYNGVSPLLNVRIRVTSSCTAKVRFIKKNLFEE